jgi:hypothetical protein
LRIFGLASLPMLQKRESEDHKQSPVAEEVPVEVTLEYDFHLHYG